MPKLICGRCGEKFECEAGEDSDEYCLACIAELELELSEMRDV